MALSVRPARWAALRSALATVEIMLGVTLAHTWAGGTLPSLPWLVGLSGLVYAASLAALRGRAELCRLAIGVGLAQFLLHGFLAWLAPAEHVHAVHAVQDPTALDPTVLGLTWQMAAAHAASALLTLLVWRLRRRAVEAILARTSPVLVPPPDVTTDPGVFAPHRCPAARVWLLGAPRRGPPLLPRCA